MLKLLQLSRRKKSSEVETRLSQRFAVEQRVSKSINSEHYSVIRLRLSTRWSRCQAQGSKAAHVCCQLKTLQWVSRRRSEKENQQGSSSATARITGVHTRQANAGSQSRETRRNQTGNDGNLVRIDDWSISSIFIHLNSSLPRYHSVLGISNCSA